MLVKSLGTSSLSASCSLNEPTSIWVSNKDWYPFHHTTSFLSCETLLETLDSARTKLSIVQWLLVSRLGNRQSSTTVRRYSRTEPESNRWLSRITTGVVHRLENRVNIGKVRSRKPNQRWQLQLLPSDHDLIWQSNCSWKAYLTCSLSQWDSRVFPLWQDKLVEILGV